MIFGVGVDMVQVSRIQQIIDKSGERFAKRVLTENEFHDYQTAVKPAHFLAKRFAAKEAASKAMGTGFSAGLSLRHIGVKRTESGKPVLEFNAKANDLLDGLGVGESYISLSDENDYAIAFVTLLRRL